MALPIIQRSLRLELAGAPAAFLWGPRQVGKTTLLHQQLPDARYYDLLDTDVKARLLVRPALLREEILAAAPELVVIDEVQKVPDLLDEIHWCIENTSTRFLLCGSSARKLRREAGGLLGGRAWRFELLPLTTAEIGKPDLVRMVNHGLLPRHYLSDRPERSLRSYVSDYLEQEVRAEALVRNVPAFARFLDAVALSHGQLTNFANIARECGVSPKTVREYYQILEDTLIGHSLEPWRRSRDRRLIETSKFYLFDPGLVRALAGMRRVEPGTDEFGRAFEHLIIEEVRAYNSYREKHAPLTYWRTSTGYEVDLIVGDLVLACEVKAVPRIDDRHLRGLLALMDDQPVGRAIVVSLDPVPRQLQRGILVLPWAEFCARLWSGALF